MAATNGNMHAVPEKAVILAAGLGERLRPLTWALPKPLLPVWGRPLIEIALRQLEAWGVREIAVNLHWMPRALERHLRGRRGPARLVLSREPSILGTGGALRPLRGFLDCERFWLVNADLVFRIDPAPLRRAFERPGPCVGVAWLHPRRGPRTVTTDAAGCVATFRAPVPGAPGTSTFCGVQLLSPRILDFLPHGRASCSILEGHEAARAAGLPLRGVAIPGSYWADAGTLPAYLEIHAELRRLARAGRPGGEWYNAARDRSNGRGRSFCCVGARVTLAAGARGRETVLWTGSRLTGRRTALARSVVAGVTWPVSGEDLAVVPAACLPEPAVPAAVAALGWRLRATAAARLGARGSGRTFWRLACGRETAILVCDAGERQENARYAGHARLLAEAGVPVPRVLADLPAHRALVLADWGDRSLARCLQRPQAHVAGRLYAQVIAAAARLHTDATALALARRSEMEPAFDADVYRWEHELFERHLVRGWLGRMALPGAVADDLAAVAARLLPAPRVIVHRDLQSSNVLCRGGRIALIDFQGMRLGPAAYDLASLLYDPYVSLAPALRRELVCRYADRVPDGGAVAALLPWAGIQRLTQALGAYGRLQALGLPAYARHIPAAAKRLAGLAAACGLPALAAFAGTVATARSADRRSA